MRGTHRPHLIRAAALGALLLAPVLAPVGGCAGPRASEKPSGERAFSLPGPAGWPEVREAVAGAAAAAGFVITGETVEGPMAKSYALTDFRGRPGRVVARREQGVVRVEASLGYDRMHRAESRVLDAFGPALDESTTWARQE